MPSEDSLCNFEPDTFERVTLRIAQVERALSDAPEAQKFYRAMAAELPVAALEGLIARYGRTKGMNGPLKYLDCPFWLAHKLRLAMRIGLHQTPSARILDLGMGGGHFSWACRRFHHDAWGIDLSTPLYDDLCHALHTPKVVHRIRRRASLPNCGARFDIVTAFASQFDFLGGDDYWTAADWIDFIERLRSDAMTARSLIYMRVNKAWDRRANEFHAKEQLTAVASHFGGSFERTTGELIVRFPD